MPTIKFASTLTITDTSGANLQVPSTKTITYTTKDDREYSITADTEQILFDPTIDVSEATSDFDFLYIISDGDALMEIECDTGAEVGREIFVITLIANVPFILGSDDSRANIISFDGFGGTLDVIDKIVAKAGSAAITLRMIIAT